MMDKDYSEKEVAIFEGTISLMKTGNNPYKIKVSDIAKAAGIGKGTVYDYFSSKEEVIAKSIVYNLYKDMIKVFNIIESQKSFKEKFYMGLEKLSEKNGFIFNILLSEGGLKKLHVHLVDEKYNLTKYIEMINEEIKRGLLQGVKEGLISDNYPDYYKIMVVRSTIGGFIQYLAEREIYKDINMEKAKETAYNILLKALN